ncbi:MAG: type III-A CRISPR-associated protein Csm2 [Ignavibacteriaceae bacterium]|jgi:CRISPR type III-A-associated protein Csm2|nr:type III-A CRISPR-associated protein Csm2 [Ignavibacteriaceae bacterium]
MKSIVISTFFDKEGQLLPLLITDEGDGNIKELIENLREQIKDKNNRNEKLNINQLRKFYDTFLKVYNTKSEEKEKKVQLLMLKANAEYSAKRLNTNRFKEFLANRINLVVSKSGEEFNKNLNALKLHFEALDAYYPKS